MVTVERPGKRRESGQWQRGRCARLINAGRRGGSIPPGPPARVVALAFVGALEGAVIALAGQAPHDELLAGRTAVGVLGLDGPPASA